MRTKKERHNKASKKYYYKHRKEMCLLAHTFYTENKEDINLKHKKYYREHKEEYAIRGKKYRAMHSKEIKLRIKEYKREHKDVLKEQNKLYKLTHKKQLKEYRSTTQVKLRRNLSSRLLLALKGNPKLFTTMKLVGCSIEKLRNHLQKQFKPGMSWKNYGKWQVDHIRPCSSFDLSKSAEQRKCFHYTNLQPLWETENLSKGDKYECICSRNKIQ